MAKIGILIVTKYLLFAGIFQEDGEERAELRLQGRQELSHR